MTSTKTTMALLAVALGCGRQALVGPKRERHVDNDAQLSLLTNVFRQVALGTYRPDG